MTHILDDWVANLKSVRYGELESYVIENWPLVGEYGIKDPETWSEYEVRLARILFGRDKEKWTQFLEDTDIEHVEETEVWNCSLDSLLNGCKTRLVKPKVLFSVDLFYDSDFAAGTWYGGWTATAFTKELALVSEYGEDDSLSFYIPIPMGLVNQNKVYQFTALLFQSCNKHWEMDRFGREDFLSQINGLGIETPEIYRLLLAYGGRGGNKILEMALVEIINYREDGMQHDYKDVLEITETKSK